MAQPLTLEGEVARVYSTTRETDSLDVVLNVRSSSLMRNHELSVGSIASLLQDLRAPWCAIPA